MTDLSVEALRARLGSRPFRTYPALLSTGADAQAWARSGGPHGGVVVADYQASPRGRSGLSWSTTIGVSLCFSMLVRPGLRPDDEGSLYLAALLGLGDALDAATGANPGGGDTLGGRTVLWWPDEVRIAGQRVGAVGVDSELDAHQVTWAVINVLVEDAGADRAGLIAGIIRAIEARLDQAPDQLATEFSDRCGTIGHRVRARMIPLGPAGPVAEGVARTCLPDGALAIMTPSGAGVAVRPQHLGLVDVIDDGGDAPDTADPHVS